jgi:1-deoxy-D-xylulose-5-phosphate reductoisomerase
VAGEIKFPAIIQTVERVVAALSGSAPITIRDIADVSAIEQTARMKATEFIKGIRA